MTSVAKILGGIVLGLTENDLSVSKINFDVALGPPDGDLTVAKEVFSVALGPYNGALQSAAIKPYVLRGLLDGEMQVMKIAVYAVLYPPGPFDLDVFEPPPPTIESQSTYYNHVVEGGITDEFNDSVVEGLNPNHGVYNLVWKVLYADQVAYIDAYLRSRGGTRPFLFTVPTESTQKVFKCKTWEVVYNGGTWTARAEFRQVFDKKRWELY